MGFQHHDNLIEKDTRLESYLAVEPKMPNQENLVLRCIGMKINHPHAVVEHTGKDLRSIARAFTDLKQRCEIMPDGKVFWEKTKRNVTKYRLATTFERQQYLNKQTNIFNNN